MQEMILTDLEGTPFKCSLEEVSELIRVPIDPDKPRATIPLEWAIGMLQAWRARNAGQFGAELAEVATGIPPSISRKRPAAAEDQP
jgi:hypothetical protein